MASASKRCSTGTKLPAEGKESALLSQGVEALTQCLLSFSDASTTEFLEFVFSETEVKQINTAFELATNTGAEGMKIAAETLSVGEQMLRFYKKDQNVDASTLRRVDELINKDGSYDKFIENLVKVIKLLGEVHSTLETAYKSKAKKLLYGLWKARYALAGLGVAIGLFLTVIGLPFAVEASIASGIAGITAIKSAIDVFKVGMDRTFQDNLSSVQDLAATTHKAAVTTLQAAHKAHKSSTSAAHLAKDANPLMKDDQVESVEKMMKDATKLEEVSAKLLEEGSKMPKLQYKSTWDLCVIS